MNHNKSGKPRLFLRVGLPLLLLLLAGAGIYIRNPLKLRNEATIPNTEVKLEDFIDCIELRGEIAVRSSAVIMAPYNAGDLQILELVPNGTHVKKGDVVVVFDPTSLQRSADQYRATLRQAEAEISRAEAQRLLAEEKNQTDIMSAQFALEKAQLDADTRDVIPAIENEKNVLALTKAEQKLRELEAKIESSRVGAEADLAGVFRKRDKAKADLDQAERNLGELALRSPGDGIITLLPNSRARTSILSGRTPVFKEGDRVWAAAEIAELPDMSTIHAVAPVYEADRGRVKPGQPVTLHIEAVPDKEHKGSVSEISTLAKLDYTSYPTRKSFDLKVQLEQPDPRLRAGMTAALRVEVERLPDSIVIPEEAVFEKIGQALAYVLSNGGYEERKLVLGRRSGGWALVEDGLHSGERVALKDPTLSGDEE